MKKNHILTRKSIASLGFAATLSAPCLAVVPAAPGPVFGPELLSNGQMEDSNARWEGAVDGESPAPKFQISTTEKHSGKSSLSVQFARGVSGYPTLRTPRFATQPGRTYRVSYWMKVSEGAVSTRRRNGADSDQRVLTGAFLNAREWTHYSIDYTERIGGPNAYLSFFPLAEKASIYLDDFSIREVTTTPASVRAAWKAKFPNRDFVVWQKKSPWENLQALRYPAPGAKEVRRLNAAMGTDEYESLSFIVTNLKDTDLHLNVGATAGKLSVTLREGLWVTAKNGSRLNDALGLLEGPLTIPPGESREVWLTLQSEKLAAGDYKGKVSLTAAGGAKASLDLSARIYPVTMPEDKPIYTCYWDNVVPSWTNPELAQAQMVDLKKHYTNVAVGHPWIVPHLAVDANGKVVEDYTELDAALEVYKTLNPKIILFNWNRDAYFVGDPHQNAKKYGKQPVYMSEEWKAAFRIWLRNWVAHMKQKGYGYDRFAMYPDDETLKPAAAEMAKLIKETDPNVLYYADHMGTTVSEVQAIAPYVDIYDPYLHEWENVPPYEAAPHKDEANRLLKKNPKYFWTYSNPASLEPQEAPPYEDYRLAVWRAWKGGMNGFGYYIYSYKSHWDSYDLTEWPTWSVVYFANDGDAPAGISKKELVVPGKRWEATREGVEDYVYLAMLKEAVEKPKPGANPQALAEGRKLLAELPAKVIANPGNEGLADQGKEAVLRLLAKLNVSKGAVKRPF